MLYFTRPEFIKFALKEYEEHIKFENYCKKIFECMKNYADELVKSHEPIALEYCENKVFNKDEIKK